MTKLRPYQQTAIDKTYLYLSGGGMAPLIVLPTGTGKSVIISEVTRDAIAGYDQTRILCVTHVKELIEQNHAALLRHWPDAPAGICSASVGKRDFHSQIVFCGIQTVFRHAATIQRCDILIIDEAHLIPRNAATMYGKFIADMKQLNPDMRIIGLTATPWRMDSGLLHKGKDAIFDGIAYEMSILDAIKQGWLAEIRSKETKAEMRVDGVGKVAGDYARGELERAVDTDELNRAIVNEIVAMGQDRRGWLIFASGVKHAHHLAELVNAAGFACGVISAETPKREREEIIAAYKAQEIRAIANMGVLTTGFDAPHTDLIAACRPTQSAGLWVQMVGRGTRLFDGKKDCLLLDFARNCRRHGPLDLIEVHAGEKGDGEAPIKTCPVCFEINHAAVKQCKACGYEFPKPPPKLDKLADTAPVLSTQIPDTWHKVTEVKYQKWPGKDGKPPTLKVTYIVGWQAFSEWVCLEHAGPVREMAMRWWRLRHNSTPRSIDDALAMSDTLRKPTEILIKPDGKFFKVTGYKWPPITMK